MESYFARTNDSRLNISNRYIDRVYVYGSYTAVAIRCHHISYLTPEPPKIDQMCLLVHLQAQAQYPKHRLQAQHLPNLHG